MKALVLALLLAAGAVHAQSQRWSAIDYYYKPEALGSLDGRIFSLESLRAGQPRPAGVLHFVHGEYGESAFSEASTWPVGEYTGLDGKEPADEKQHGAGECSAFQVEAGKGLDVGSAGWVMKTGCAPLSDDPAHRFVNMQANVAWAADQMPRPWQTPASRFGMEFSLKIPSAKMLAGAKGYATAQLQIHDGDGHFFWMQPTLFLAGFAPGAQSRDSTGLDQNIPYINPVYRSRGRYLSKFDNPVTHQVSHVTASRPWAQWHWYAFTVSSAQLLAAVTDLNAKGGKYSTDLSGYGISLIGVQTEINRQAVAPGKTPEGWIGVGLKQLYAYRLY
ncbi:hypothetical protein ACFPOE_09895 [Caenimonas terrae]|uniref:Carotenoid 1,2-hydratase n=1 Tax=Caenimonas terrae TaxID=696074 RepID=A0ABW0NEZ6_9BURK